MNSPMQSLAAMACLALALAVPLSAQTTETDTRPTTVEELSRAVVYSSAEEAQPLEVGDAMPRLVRLGNAPGETVGLAEATGGESSVIVFYRGGWCPYCNTHLAELARIQPQLSANGVKILAISPDSAETIAGYQAEEPMPFLRLSDSRHEAMKAFGLAFRVDEETVELYRGYGIDLAAASGNPDPVLPVTSVFVVNESGQIVFAHSNAEYRERMSGNEILKAAGLETVVEDAPKTGEE